MDVKALLPSHVVIGAAFESELYGSCSFTVLSLPQDKSFWSCVQHSPLTMLSCACDCQTSLRLGRSHTLTTPSPLPLAKRSSAEESFASVYTPSTWPFPSCATKGAANMRSSLVALSARVYSLALSNGCSAGSRFRGWRATSLPGAWCELVERESALIFYKRCQYHDLLAV